MQELLTKHADQINDVARYAKRVNFNFETGNFDEMMKGWIEDGRKFQVMVSDNKTDFQRQVKKFIN